MQTMVRTQASAWRLMLMMVAGAAWANQQCSKTCAPHFFDLGGGCPAFLGMSCTAGPFSKGVCQCANGQTCASDSSICKVEKTPEARDCNKTTCKPSNPFDHQGGCKNGQTCSAGFPAQGICMCPVGTTCSSDGVCQTYKVPEARDCASSCSPSMFNPSGGCKLTQGQSCSTSVGTGVCQCGVGQTCSANSKTCQMMPQPDARNCNQTTCLPAAWDWPGGCKNGQTCSSSQLGIQGACQCPVSTVCTSQGTCKSTKTPELVDCHTTCSVSAFNPLGGCKLGQKCSSNTGVGVCQCSSGQHCSADGEVCSTISTNKPHDCKTTCKPDIINWNGGCQLGQTCSAVWPHAGHCYCNNQQDTCSSDSLTCISSTAQTSRLWENVKVQTSNLMSIAPPIVLVPAGLVAAVMMSMAVRKYKQRPAAGVVKLLQNDVDESEIESPGATAE